MKLLVITISIVLGGLSFATLTVYTANTELREQLQTALSYREQLNEQAGEYARQRLSLIHI